MIDEQKYYLTIQNISDPLFLINSDFKIIFLNKSAENLTGQQNEKINDRIITDLIDSVSKDKHSMLLTNLQISLTEKRKIELGNQIFRSGEKKQIIVDLIIIPVIS
ncbi:PAS domain S-box protein, partial [Bacteroidota bacterium]